MNPKSHYYNYQRQYLAQSDLPFSHKTPKKTKSDIQWDKNMTINSGPAKQTFFLLKEDECLKKAIQAIGQEKWNQVAVKFNQIFFSTHGFKPNRIAKQCRQRWLNKLSPALKSNQEKWTQQQDNVMIDAYKEFGSSWSKIIQLLFNTFSIRRSDNGIKNHFHALIKKRIKQLNQFIDLYNQQSKRKGLFEQKPKKKYFYPKQLSLEKQLRIKKKFQSFPQQSLQNPSQMPVFEQAQPTYFQNTEQNLIQNERPLLNDFDLGTKKQTLIVKRQQEGTKQKFDSMKEECMETVNIVPVKYRIPFKTLDKKIVDRLLFVLIDKKNQEPQYASLILPNQTTFVPIRNSFLEYIKNPNRFTYEKKKQLAEGFENYHQFIRKSGKKVFCPKKPKKIKQEQTNNLVHKNSRKLFEKIKQRYPEHQRSFSVARHQILARINVLVLKTRQKQLEMQDQIKKKYFLRKEEQQIIIEMILKEALNIQKIKKEQTKKKKQAVWQYKKKLRQEQLQKQKQNFIAKGGTSEQFESIQEENRRLKIENLRLKAKIQNQKNKLSKSNKRGRIIRQQISKTKPIRKNKQKYIPNVYGPPHPNPLNQFSFKKYNQKEQLMTQTYQRVQFPLLSDQKDSQNIFPFLSNGIHRLPESYNFFDNFSRAKLNQIKNVGHFYDHIRTIQMQNQNRQQVKQEFSQQLIDPPQPIQPLKWDKNLTLKTESQQQDKPVNHSNNSKKNHEIDDSIKKNHIPQPVFKIPFKNPLEQNQIESEYSQPSLKSKKSIRPKILIRQEQFKKPQTLSLSNLRKETSFKSIQMKDSSFQIIKKGLPDFLAKSIQLPARQNQLDRSWKFNFEQDSNSLINSNKSNFFAFVPEDKNHLNRFKHEKEQFFKNSKNSQQLIGPNSVFNKVTSTNYYNANKNKSIYNSFDFLTISCQNLGQQKVRGQNKQNGDNNQESNVEMNSFLNNIRKIEQAEGTQWKEPKVYHFIEAIPQNLQKQSVQMTLSNTKKGFSAFNPLNSQPIDFEIPEKLIETARNTNFPLRNCNDYSLNYQHRNSIDLSKVFEFDRKFGLNSAIFSEMEFFKSLDRNEQNKFRSNQFDMVSNMFKSQRIQSLHESSEFLNKSRPLSTSCIYSNHDDKSISGGKQLDNTKSIQKNAQRLSLSQMEDQQKPKK